MMAEFQVGRKMSEPEIAKVKTFLDAQTGQFQGKTLTNTNEKK